MADWSKLTGRGNVEDRRGFGPGLGGGLGLTGLAVYLLFNYLSTGTVDVGAIFGELQNTQVAQVQNYNAEDFQGADSYEVFVSTVLGSTNEMWRKIFANNSIAYEEPKLVLFRGRTTSSCGGAMTSVGPHYCPPDETIYVDETFFDELTKRLGATGGDVAEAYVIAHEVGHHVQNELGITNHIDQTSNEDSIKLELQADCFAGLWLNSIKDLNVYEPHEINEAMDAARAVGDDHIQEETTGRVNPEQWTHGSSAERTQWFNRGYTQGSVSACDTFSQ